MTKKQLPLILLLLFAQLFSSKLFSFTFNNNVTLAFNQKNVAVHLAQGFCQNLNLSDDQLMSLIEEAIDDYWNTVPTSKLILVIGQKKSLSSSYYSDPLCSSGTSNRCTPNVTIKVDNDIVVSCNTNSTNFPSPAILASSMPNNFSGNTIYGSLVLINDTASNGFKSRNREQQKAIIAHEIGHAIGLGHSPVKDSLMYYSDVNYRTRLGLDDIDGVTYLYPKEQPFSCNSSAAFFVDKNLNQQSSKKKIQQNLQAVKQSILANFFSFTLAVVIAIILRIVFNQTKLRLRARHSASY